MKNQNSSQLNSGSAPLAFLTTAFIFLCLASLWLVVRPGMLLGAKPTPQATAWLYLLIYGFALPGVFGLIYLAIPLIFKNELYSSQFVILHLAFHLAALLMIIPAEFMEWSQSTLGQTFLACGVIIFLVNVTLSFPKERQAEASSAFFCAAAFWLAIMQGIGLPLANEPLLPFLRKSDWSFASLALCIAGVVFNSILGLALRLTSMRLKSEAVYTESAWVAFALTNFGVAWLFAAITYGPPGFIFFCGAIYFFGVLIYLGRFLSILQFRPQGKIDWDSKILLTALSMIPIGILVLEASVMIRWMQPQSSNVLNVIIVLVALLGVTVPGIVALCYQIMRLTRANLNSLLSEQILLAAFFNYAVGACLIISGSWTGIEKMLSLGVLFQFAGSCGFFFNFSPMLYSNQRTPGERQVLETNAG